MCILIKQLLCLLDTVILQMQVNVPATRVEMAAHAKTRKPTTYVNVRPVSRVSTVKQVWIIHKIMLPMGLILRSYNWFFFWRKLWCCVYCY